MMSMPPRSPISRDLATSIGTSADAIASDRAPKLESLDARIAELGPAPAKGSPPEAADIAAQRTALDQQHAALDAEIKRAKLLKVDSQQLLAQIDEARRASFQARLSQRTASPLTPAFWKNIAVALGEDSARLAALRSGVMSALRDAFAPDNRAYAFAGIVIGLLLIVFGRWWAERALMRLTADRVPHGRLRRSAVALAVVVVATVFTGFGVEAMIVGIDWHEALSDTERKLAHALVNAVFFGSFVAGLGRALLSPSRPSWRLPAIGDDVAASLRVLPWALGGAVALSIMLRRINTIVGASISATVAASMLSAVLYGAIIMWGLIRLIKARARATPRSRRGRGGSRNVFAVGTIRAGGDRHRGRRRAARRGRRLHRVRAIRGRARRSPDHHRRLAVSACAPDRGYLLDADRDPREVDARDAQRAAAHARSGRRRCCPARSAWSRSCLRCRSSFRAAAAGAPSFPRSARRSARAASRSARSRSRQMRVFGAIAVCLVGLLAIRVMKHWLHERYLPTTSLDPAMRSSITTLLGYVGGIVVFAFALSELGISVERIAWVASALSVGIGFGLQAVVQNFVSGLILLVERPVKVGDWVALGDIEGDIRRINVRATEIQMSDRLDDDRAEFRAHHQDRAQRDARERAGPRAGPPADAARYRRRRS